MSVVKNKYNMITLCDLLDYIGQLVTYLSYYKEPILISKLSKKEFANNTSMSGYQYMTYVDGD